MDRCSLSPESRRVHAVWKQLSERKWTVLDVGNAPSPSKNTGAGEIAQRKLLNLGHSRPVPAGAQPVFHHVLLTSESEYVPRTPILALPLSCCVTYRNVSSFLILSLPNYKMMVTIRLSSRSVKTVTQPGTP